MFIWSVLICMLIINLSTGCTDWLSGNCLHLGLGVVAFKRSEQRSERGTDRKEILCEAGGCGEQGGYHGLWGARTFQPGGPVVARTVDMRGAVSATTTTSRRSVVARPSTSVSATTTTSLCVCLAWPSCEGCPVT